MAEQHRAWKRQGEAFWRAHHEAWKRSDLNQRQYCEAHDLPQKAFENRRLKFRAEPEPVQTRAWLGVIENSSPRVLGGNVIITNGHREPSPINVPRRGGI